MLIGDYKKLLQSIIDKKYSFVKFGDIDNNKDSQIILRHDIDLDIDLALDMAIIENTLDIKSTYFFLLTNDSYNLISERNSSLLMKIKQLGHSISLHFDMEIYKDPKKGLEIELDIFKKNFQERVDIVSIHRPSQDFLKNPNGYFNVNNSYEDIFTKNAKYFADSGGNFKYGSPVNSKAFRKNENLQLLIHPIWWINSENTIKETVNKTIDNKRNKLEEHFKKNIKTYS
tara:strand:- start:2581 stop:3267 length:687 start_codon:yes stop_codon:yes gene_type:complete